jgi:hypothetical protein
MEGISFRGATESRDCWEPVLKERVTASGVCPVKAIQACNRTRSPRNRLRACFELNKVTLRMEGNPGGTAKDLRP